MTSTFTCRGIEPADADSYTQWLLASRNTTLMDKKVYSYPTCISLVVEKDGEAIMMNSFHIILAVGKDFKTASVLMCEALAIKPGINKRDIIYGLKELFNGIKKIADALGYKEIWFQSLVDGFQNLLTKHGFVKIVDTLLKIAVNLDNQPIREMWITPSDEDLLNVLLSAGAKIMTVPTFAGAIRFIG